MKKSKMEEVWGKIQSVICFDLQNKYLFLYGITNEIMRAVNYSELRQNLKANLNSVTDNEELLVVHRPKGKSIVMMTLDEYNALQETQHLLQSRNNRERLEKAIENVNAGKNLAEHDLVED